jgi:hypothetical protein
MSGFIFENCRDQVMTNQLTEIFIYEHVVCRCAYEGTFIFLVVPRAAQETFLSIYAN